MPVVYFDLPKKMKMKKTIALHVELLKCITRNNVSMAPTPNETLRRHYTRRDGHGSTTNMSKILRML
jgi:hypothetical protein